MIPYAPHEWRPEERPMMPGSPSTPAHPPHLRLAYGVVGCLIAVTGGMSNALVTAYQQYLQGMTLSPSPTGGGLFLFSPLSLEC